MRYVRKAASSGAEGPSAPNDAATEEREHHSEREKRYVFRSTWRVAAQRQTVRDVLLAYERYPMWWKQVRSVQRTHDGMRTVCRSLLPYDLVFTAVQYALNDGVLAVELRGDLEGIAQWRLFDSGKGTRLEYEQDVYLEKSVLRWLSPVLRPAFRFNHWLMMRDGEAGLKTYLAGVTWHQTTGSASSKDN